MESATSAASPQASVDMDEPMPSEALAPEEPMMESVPDASVATAETPQVSSFVLETALEQQTVWRLYSEIEYQPTLFAL